MTIKRTLQDVIDLRLLQSPGVVLHGSYQVRKTTLAWAVARRLSIRSGDRTGQRKVGVEIKFSSAPKPTKGFWLALQDLQIDHAYVIAPVSRRYPLAERVEVLPLAELSTLLG